jgi:hypothetical protein
MLAWFNWRLEHKAESVVILSNGAGCKFLLIERGADQNFEFFKTDISCIIGVEFFEREHSRAKV